MNGTFTFLGTGTSVGVPVIGCRCAVCTSPDPRNKRTRSSALIHFKGGTGGPTVSSSLKGGTGGPPVSSLIQIPSITLLVDSGPDLREQALREGLHQLDAVLYTHSHLDHVVGFDELRAFCWRRDEPLPMHATRECMDTLKQMFGWAFSEENVYKGYVKPAAHIIEAPFFYGDLKITPLPVEHAAVETIGYRFDHPEARNIAYLPDVKRVPIETMELLRGVDILIVDALRPEPHATHCSINEALEIIRQAAPGEAWLTHLGHENDHAALSSELPPGVRVAWDGLQIAL